MNTERMTHTRREFFLSAAGLATLPRQLRGNPHEQFQGIFPIMQTPFTDSGALDLDALGREALFLHRLGVPGMVWPQLASEYSSLSFDERLKGAETLIHALEPLAKDSRPALVIGVQAPDTATAVKYARHSEKLQPDGIIAIPLAEGKELDMLVPYYSAIAANCSRPLFVQTMGEMSVEFVLRMAAQIPTLRYVKDEAGQTLARISEYRRRGRELIRGVFTGAHGRTLIDELARGAAGTMPAAAFADLYVSVWDAWQRGQRERAIDMFSKVLLLIAQVQAYGLEAIKYVLQLRGVISNTRCRTTFGPAAFDDEARRSIRETITFLRPYLKT